MRPALFLTIILFISCGKNDDKCWECETTVKMIVSGKTTTTKSETEMCGYTKDDIDKAGNGQTIKSTSTTNGVTARI